MAGTCGSPPCPGTGSCPRPGPPRLSAPDGPPDPPDGALPRRVRALAQVRRAAAVALVFLAVGFSGLMVTSQAFRTQVIAVITQVFQEFTEFRFSAREETARRAGDVALTYLPEGMEEIRRSGNHINLHIFFEDATGNTMRLTHTVIGDKTSHVSMLDTEDAEVEQFYIQGEQATAISKGLDHTILWTSGNSVYLLTGTIAMDELKLVAAGSNDPEKNFFKNFWTNCQKHPPSVVMVYERTEGGDFYAYQSKQAAGRRCWPCA